MYRIVLLGALLMLPVAATANSGWATDLTVNIKSSTLDLPSIDQSVWFAFHKRNEWNGRGELFSEHWQVLMGKTTQFKLFKYGIGYRYTKTDRSKEHRPFVFFGPQFTAFHQQLVITIGNELNYNFRNNKENGFGYKIKPKLLYTVKVNSEWNIVPFVSNESTYQWGSGNWTKNKTEVGVGIVYKSRYSLSPYYKHEQYLVLDREHVTQLGVVGNITF